MRSIFRQLVTRRAEIQLDKLAKIETDITGPERAFPKENNWV